MSKKSATAKRPKKAAEDIEEVSDEGDAAASAAKRARSTLVKDLERLLQDPSTADVTVFVGEKRKPVKVHRAILMARSPVLWKAFALHMKEKAANELEMPDADELAFQQFIKFIYTDSLELTKPPAVDEESGKELTYTPEERQAHEAQQLMNLMYLVDKYNIESLATRCAELFVLCLNKSTCWAIAEVAQQHNMPTLHASAVMHVVNSVNEMTDEQLEGLQDVSYDVILSILRHRQGACARERVACLKRWLEKHHKEINEEKLDGLYSAARSFDMSIEDFYQYVISAEHPPSRGFITDALLYRSMPGLFLSDPKHAKKYRQWGDSPHMRIGFWSRNTKPKDDEHYKFDISRAGMKMQRIMGDRSVKRFSFSVSFKQRYKLDSALKNGNRQLSFGFVSPNWWSSDDGPKTGNKEEEPRPSNASLVMFDLSGAVTWKCAGAKSHNESPANAFKMSRSHGSAKFEAHLTKWGFLFVQHMGAAHEAVLVNVVEGVSHEDLLKGGLDHATMLPVITAGEGCEVELYADDKKKNNENFVDVESLYAKNLINGVPYPLKANRKLTDQESASGHIRLNPAVNPPAVPPVVKQLPLVAPAPPPPKQKQQPPPAPPVPKQKQQPPPADQPVVPLPLPLPLPFVASIVTEPAVFAPVAAQNAPPAVTNEDIEDFFGDDTTPNTEERRKEESAAHVTWATKGGKRAPAAILQLPKRNKPAALADTSSSSSSEGSESEKSGDD